MAIYDTLNIYVMGIFRIILLLYICTILSFQYLYDINIEK